MIEFSKRNRFILLYTCSVILSSTLTWLFVVLEWGFFNSFQSSLLECFLSSLIYIMIFFVFRNDKLIPDYTDFNSGLRVIISNTISYFIILAIYLFNIFPNLFRYMSLLQFLLLNLFSIGIIFYKKILNSMKKEIYSEDCKRVVIYGAGRAGMLLAAEISLNKHLNYILIGFIDDNPDLKNRLCGKWPIFGNGNDLASIVEKHRVDEILIAIPSISKKQMSNIVNKLINEGIDNVKIMRSIALNIDESKVSTTLRDVEIKDLLPRKEIIFNDEKVVNHNKEKTILVSGAAGSIGSELVRQLITFHPAKLILIDINESGLYNLQQEISRLKTNNGISTDVVYLVASIVDKNRLKKIFATYKIDMIYHAAAYKHVPLMEDSPYEAINNNILGSYNLINMAIEHNVKSFTSISTDKAVNPTNVMGATKRFVEKILQSEKCKNSNTIFSAVRFGNVLGSNGSVIPLFKNQIKNGGPITVTHKDIIRYFMTIPEAVSLVLQASTYAKGGEIFVLDMGEPVKILDLAKNLIKLSGYNETQIPIVFTGLRPGEKLYEELLMEEEGLSKTDNKLIFVTRPMTFSDETIEKYMNILKESIDLGSNGTIIDALSNAVETFKRS